MQTESCSVTPSLQAISTKLEEWRISKKENNTLKARIPNYLWDEISQLFDFYPLSKIRKVLSLNPIQLKSRLKKYHNKKSIKPHQHHKTSFVPINLPKPSTHTIEEVEPESIGKVELKRPDGAVIFIERLNQKTLTNLLTQFMQGL